MKTQAENVQRWDDIIFENRNKEYGAYAIRKDYKNRVLKAEAISIGIGALIFIIPILMRNEVPLPIISKPDEPIVLKPFTGKIEPEAKPQTPKPPRRIDASVVPITPTTKDVPDPPAEPPKQGVTYTNPPDNGATGSEQDPDPSEGSGTGTPAAVEAPKVFDFVEKMPEYEGGYEAMMKFVQKKMRYPSIAIRKRDEGTVYVQFVITPEGTVVDVKIVKGISKECDAEAVRVISMMNKWKPGIQNNHAVSVRTTIPITFRLE
ncbi:MAG TPA: TonB family protein [Cyclobacteriaceae bacterium]|nr:TonB family protein [Cyclobacteriaceae bacterium]